MEFRPVIRDAGYLETRLNLQKPKVYVSGPQDSGPLKRHRQLRQSAVEDLQRFIRRILLLNPVFQGLNF
ncbi:hypothetical protein TNCV_2770641 [Trichonephila clavipes]|nr:hypothetical protein TNCV_2770641 [Trichonephila clavipes]